MKSKILKSCDLEEFLNSESFKRFDSIIIIENEESLKVFLAQIKQLKFNTYREDTSSYFDAITRRGIAFGFSSVNCDYNKGNFVLTTDINEPGKEYYIYEKNKFLVEWS